MNQDPEDTPAPAPARGGDDDGGAPAGAPRRGPRPLPPGLHLLATPIGAADDLTIRGRDALATADRLACEDTRVLRRLMELHGVPLAGRPITAYHDHNAAQARGPLLAALAAGQSVLYASDAGTPLVADPGWRLAQAAREIGAAVHALPGPSAVLTALVLSGLPTDRFAFGGFLPPKAGARRRALESWRAVPGTLIFFESARRAAATLADVRDVLGAEREAALARELTKAFEQVRRGTAAELAEGAAADPPRGEVVLLIGPAPAEGAPDPAALDAALREALAAGTLKDAVRTVVERLSAPRKMVYARALELAEERKDPE